jgi:hypothetical protein
MKRYKVKKLTYPTVIVINDQEYILFPGQIVKLPDAEIVETYEGLGYLEPVTMEIERYKVKLTYPTIIVINDQEYILFPGQVVELPDAEIVETYKGLRYLEPITDTEV